MHTYLLVVIFCKEIMCAPAIPQLISDWSRFRPESVELGCENNCKTAAMGHCWLVNILLTT